MEVLNEVLNILFEFGGGKGGEPNNVVVRFLLPAFFWTVLAGIAVKEWCRTRERKDFYVGAASLMGIARELLMFTAEYGSLRGYIPFEFLYKYYPPLEHAWTMLSCIFIGYAFLNYLSKWRHFPAMFLMITSTVTVILYSVIASLWPFFLEYNPGASFGTFWGDLVFRISASLFMGIVLGAFIFARSRGRYVPQPLLWGFLFLFLDEFLMIFNIISGERYVHIYAPVRHNLHIWAIPLFLGVYWADTIRRMASAEHAIRRTFELSPSMLCIIGYDGIIRVASPASKQILGLAPEELQGLSVTELGFDSRDHGLSPLTPDAGSEEQSAFEREIIREDGTARWLHWKIQPAGKEKMLYAVVSDITENKLAKDRLEAVYKTTRDIINNAPFGIYVVNETGRVEYVNPVMLQIAGYSHEQFVKLNVFTLPFYISIGLTEKIKKGLRGERFRMDSVEFSSYFQRDKAVLNFTGIPLDEGNGKKVLMIVEDITERAKLEAQLVQAQKMEVIGQLAGGIAHDFNNILTGIIGTGALMKARMGRHNLFEQSLDQIIGLANRAGKLTQGLLTFSRKRTTKLQPVDINDIIGNLQKILARLIREGIDLEVELCPGKLPVMADAGQIEQVLMNLATNARDAMPHGGKLIIGTGLAGPGDGLMKSGDHGETGEYALVSVQDTGVGMDKHI
ncbi:MAG TPA: PAS domain S-box protein, partial [Dissulfurispiraceae bacterium]